MKKIEPDSSTSSAGTPMPLPSQAGNQSAMIVGVLEWMGVDYEFDEAERHLAFGRPEKNDYTPTEAEIEKELKRDRKARPKRYLKGEEYGQKR